MSTAPSAEGDVPTLAAEGDASQPSGPPVERGLSVEEGDQLGRYAVQSRLGAGGMGVVYAAHDPQLDRRVAVKLLLPMRSGEEASQRLLREAQAMARLNHPNVVTVYDAGTTGTQVYVAMEFVEGLTLRKWMREQRPTPTEALELLIQAGEGLAAAHDEGLVHRDFKPDNVMVSSNPSSTGGSRWRARVMDFGLARTTESVASGEGAGEGLDSTREDAVSISSSALSGNLTATGALLGSPKYMAPEQFARRPTDPRTDQFAFCVTAWEVLYGRRPFKAHSVMELAVAVSRGQVRAPPSDSPVPSWILPILERGLRASPEERWPSMRALIAALARDPRKRMRRIAAASAFGALAVAGVIGYGWRAHAIAASCEEAGQELDSTWNEAAKQGLRTAMVEAGVASADATYSRIEAALSQYSEQWSQTRAEACRRTRVDGSRSEASLVASNHCLDQRRRTLEHFVDRLRSDPSAMAQQMAIVSATSLPPVDDCIDEKWLATRTDPPPQDSARIDEVDAQLSLAHIVYALGDYAEANELAEAAQADAHEIGWPLQEARADVLAGTIHERVGKFDEARTELERASFRAAMAGDHELAIRAKLALMSIHASALRDFDRAMEISELLEAELQEHGLTEHLLAGKWLNLRGIARQEHGDLDEAAADFERAIELHEATMGPDHSHTAGPVENLAVLRASQMRLEEAAELYQRGLQIQLDAVGEHHPDVAYTHNGLATIELQKGNWKAAEDHLLRTIAILELVLPEDSPRMAIPLGNLGHVNHSLGQFDKAIEFFERSMAMWEKAAGAEHMAVAQVLLGLGQAEIQAERLVDARAHFERCLAIYEKSMGPDHPDVAYPLVSLGALELDQGAHEAARDAYQRAVTVRAGHIPVDDPRHASALFGLAAAKWELGEDRDAARRDVQHAAEILRKAPPGMAEGLPAVEAWLETHPAQAR